MFCFSICKDPGTNEEALVPMPFLLPHEMLASMFEKNNLAVEDFANTPSTEMQDLKRKVCRELGLDPRTCIPLGLHGDGVPHQKQGSVEVLSWNFLGVPESERMLCAIAEKKFCSPKTVESMLEIIAWSFRCLFTGKWPSARHDGTPFTKDDKWRQGKASQNLPGKSVLMQVRGDWAWYKDIFHFPAWSNLAICWRCAADKESCDYKDFSPDAKWRSRRTSPDQFWSNMRRNGVTPSCLFSLPGFTLEMVTIDALHAADLGVVQDAIGNVLWEYVHSPQCPGSNLADKVKQTWLDLKEYYKAMQSPSRLQGLTKAMIKQDGKPPKLRAKGAETRHALGFAVQCAQKMHNESPTLHNTTVLKCISALMDINMLMNLEEWRPDLAKTSCQTFASMYVALSKESQRTTGKDTLWRVKPKMHMMEYQSQKLGNPRLYWDYDDEDFVGWVSKIATSRGGPKQTATTAKKVLERYRAMTG